MPDPDMQMERERQSDLDFAHEQAKSRVMGLAGGQGVGSRVSNLGYANAVM